MQAFLLLGRPRSGTTMLQTALDGHPQICCAGEVFFKLHLTFRLWWYIVPFMKTLKQYACDHGVKYRAAWNRFKAGKIPEAFQDEFGKILIPEDAPDIPAEKRRNRVKNT